MMVPLWWAGILLSIIQKTIQSLQKIAKNIHEKEIWNGERPRQSRERSSARILPFPTVLCPYLKAAVAKLFAMDGSTDAS